MRVLSIYKNYLRRKFLKEPGVAGSEYQWQCIAALLPLMIGGAVAWRFEMSNSDRQILVASLGSFSFLWLGFISYQWLAVKNHEHDKVMRLNGLQKTKALDIRTSRNG